MQPAIGVLKFERSGRPAPPSGGRRGFGNREFGKAHRSRAKSVLDPCNLVRQKQFVSRNRLSSEWQWRAPKLLITGTERKRFGARWPDRGECVFRVGGGLTKRILIVDDNEDVRRILGLRLRHAGFEVGDAAGGAEALEVLGQGGWDLVLLDLIMPGVDGFEVLRSLRERKGRARSAPPVVVITQYDDIENRQRALALGAARYVAKGNAFDRGFVGSLRQWLGQSDPPARRDSRRSRT